MQDYFNSWDAKNYNALDKDLKDIIYKKYLMKFKVFNRDHFMCQNRERIETEDGEVIIKPCPFCSNKQYYSHLTVHHIKAKRNGGKDTERNGMTLCKTSHQHYEKAKGSITISDGTHIPSHIRGHTFKLSKPIEINWKKVRAEMKKKRKEFRDKWGITLTGAQIEMLMKFLKINFDDLD